MEVLSHRREGDCGGDETVAGGGILKVESGRREVTQRCKEAGGDFVANSSWYSSMA